MEILHGVHVNETGSWYNTEAELLRSRITRDKTPGAFIPQKDISPVLLSTAALIIPYSDVCISSVYVKLSQIVVMSEKTVENEKKYVTMVENINRYSYYTLTIY